MNAIETAQFWAKSKAQVPPEAEEFREWYMQHWGASYQNIIAAWVAYAQISMELPCPDPNLHPRQTDVLWFRARGIAYKGPIRQVEEDEDEDDDLDGGCFYEDIEEEDNTLENGGVIMAEDTSEMSKVGEKVVNGKTISSCWQQCPLFREDEDGMYCGHKFFDGKDYWDRKIISWDDDIQEAFPPQCPLWK